MERQGLSNFSDKRSTSGGDLYIGETKAAFNVTMANVYADKSMRVILKKALEVEFRKCNHKIVEDEPDVTLKGNIEPFWIGTDVTALYWDVYGEIGLIIKATKHDSVSERNFAPYYAKNVKRTYKDPGRDIMKSVIEKSLGQVVQQMFSDPSFVKTLEE